MSIASLPFPEGLVYKDYNGVEYGSTLYYVGNDQSFKYKVVTPIHLVTQLQAAWTVTNLIRYLDGGRVDLRYKLSKTTQNNQNTYTFYWQVLAYDKNGTVIFNPAEASYSVVTDPAHEEVMPFTDWYYCPSVADFRIGTTPTVINQPANSVDVQGQLWYKKPQPPVGGYIDFAPGIYAASELEGSYQKFITTYPATNDSELTTYFNTADPDGVWHTVGEPEEQPEPSEPGGGDTPSADGGDVVDFPGLPTTNILETGLVSAFSPSAAQLRSLATVLWGNDFEQSIKKILNDPFDGIIGFSLLPFAPTTSAALNCVIGNFDTEVSMPPVTQQYVTLDCGTVQIKENWKNALDYNSTDIAIYIPFVGFRTLSIDDCMNRTLSLKYNVDVISGSGVAILKCGDKCLYNYPCKLSYDVPLTGSNKAALYTGMVNIAMTGLTGAAAGGAMGAVGGAAASAINVGTHKQSNIERSGAITSNTGVLGDFTPYVVMHRPVQSMPKDFKKIKGYQSNITRQLSTCSGYTEVEFIHLSNITMATDAELQEIERLLKTGVII